MSTPPTRCDFLARRCPPGDSTKTCPQARCLGTSHGIRVCSRSWQSTSARLPAWWLPPKRAGGVQPQRLFPDEVTPPMAEEVPVSEGVVLQTQGADGHAIAIAQPVAVVDASPLHPVDEAGLRHHLDAFFVGRQFELRHLTSAAGQRLNGQLGQVVGRDDTPGRYRLHVSVDGAAPIRVSACNLAPPGRAPRPAAPLSGEAATLVALGAVLAGYPPSYRGRADTLTRVGLLRVAVEAGRVPAPTRCGAYLVGHDATSFVQVIDHKRPCCSGDNECDLRRFDAGDHAALREWCITGTCAACQAVMFR